MSDIFDRFAPPDRNDPASAMARAHAGAKAELPKRFYAAATAGAADDGHRVLLDGRPVRTPARAVLAVPSAEVAEVLAAEWNAQGERIDPSTMPLTRIVNIAIDGIAAVADAVKDEIAAYAASDLLIYRAEGPERLVERQTATWDSIVAHAERRLGVRVRLAEGVMPIDQDPALSSALRGALPDDVFALAGLHTVTTLTGSALIALALLDGLMDADTAFAAAHLDEDWNVELWGEDAEATLRRSFRHREMTAAALLVSRFG